MCLVSLLALVASAVVVTRQYINSYITDSDIVVYSGSPLEVAALAVPHLALLAAWRLPPRWQSVLLSIQALATLWFAWGAGWIFEHYGLLFWTYHADGS